MSWGADSNIWIQREEKPEKKILEKDGGMCFIIVSIAPDHHQYIKYVYIYLFKKYIYMYISF